MRTAILFVAIVGLAGCHKSYKSGFKKMGSNIASIGKGAANIAKKAVPVKMSPVEIDAPALHIDANVQTALVAVAKQKAADRVASIEPISIQKSVKHVDHGEPAPAPVQVEPVVTRRSVDTGGDQIWKNTWRNGEKASCEKVSDFDSCQSTCSDILRGESMRQLDPKAGKPMQCECTQGYSKC